MNPLKRTYPKIAAEIGARLAREPFVPFAVETEDAVHHVIVRWQAMVSDRNFFFGEPSGEATGCVSSHKILIINLAFIKAVVEAEGSLGSIAETVETIVAESGAVRVFTDGACQGNPGPGGWAFIVKNEAGEELGRGSGGERPTTNNRMELTSAIRGLEALAPDQSVRLITDSQYVAKGLAEWMKGWKQRGWKRKTAKGLEPVANEDLWRRLDELATTRKIVCEWVRGHAGHPENEECDQMAVEAAANV